METRHSTRIPWTGLLALLGALGITAATVVVLATSNGKPKSAWPYRARTRPTVPGRHLNKVALAYLLAFLAALDGPLLQRASTTTAQLVTNTAYDLSNPQGADEWNVGYACVIFYGHENDVIRVETAHKPGAGTTGDLILAICSLHSATARYPIELANGTATPLTRPADANDTVAMYYQPIGASLPLHFSGTYVIMADGPMGYMYMTPDSTPGSPSMACADPMPEIVAGIRKLTSRSALANSNASASQDAQGAPSRRHRLWRPAVCRVWCHGRAFSLSPVEITRAFDAPLTRDADSNAEVGALLKQIGDRKVRYCYVAVQQGKDGEGTRLLSLGIRRFSPEC
ncbi:hypothetical protein DL771_010638 [Monosporascus sp. 5C6A]|nr:hypothetical protein DL771_010638 [Monosporascus sp. 5C6A]